MCDKAVDNYFRVLKFIPEYYKCVIKLLIFILLKHILFLIDLKVKKCVIKLLIFI